jgi:hypothetical protein
MTAADHGEDKVEKAEGFRKPLSGGLRIVGGIVILATAVVITFAAMWIFAPEVLTYSRQTEDLMIRVVVTSLVMSSAGGLFMVAMTKNPLWLLTLFATGGLVALWLLIAKAMGPLMH